MSSLNAAKAASLTIPLRSAPVLPSVCSEMSSRFTSSAKETVLEWMRKASRRSSGVFNAPTSKIKSNLPGLVRAGSRASNRFVVAMTKTDGVDDDNDNNDGNDVDEELLLLLVLILLKPSISVSKAESTRAAES